MKYLSPENYMKTITATLYETLQKEYSVTIDQIAVAQQPIIIFVVSKSEIEISFKKVSEAYMEYTEKYKGDYIQQVKDYAAFIKAFEEYINSNNEIEIRNE